MAARVAHAGEHHKDHEGHKEMLEECNNIFVHFVPFVVLESLLRSQMIYSEGRPTGSAAPVDHCSDLR